MICIPAMVRRINESLPNRPIAQTTWDAIVTTVTSTSPSRFGEQSKTIDATLQERSLRLVRFTNKIAARLPLSERPIRPDLASIAALYIGLTGVIRQSRLLELASDQLHGLLLDAEKSKIIEILSEYRKRKTLCLEARLVADAIALEDFGLIGMWSQAATYHALGRGLSQFLHLWRVRSDYGYWGARLRTGFHFDISRQIAQERFMRMQTVMHCLQQEESGSDIA